jgi:hypothetical protein
MNDVIKRNRLAVYQSNNGWDKKKNRAKVDGNYFASEAGKYADYWETQGDVCTVIELSSSSMGVRRGVFSHAIEGLKVDGSRFSRFAFFGHGLPRSLPMLGMNAVALADCIASVAEGPINVALYACWCGIAGYSYDDALCNAMHAKGINATVFAHSTRGCTTHNPNAGIIRIVDNVLTELIAYAKTPKEKRKLRAMLVSDPSLRFRLPEIEPKDLVVK